MGCSRLRRCTLDSTHGIFHPKEIKIVKESEENSARINLFITDRQQAES